LDIGGLSMPCQIHSDLDGKAVSPRETIGG
jgi:hypothetical protein